MWSAEPQGLLLGLSWASANLPKKLLEFGGRLERPHLSGLRTLRGMSVHLAKKIGSFFLGGGDPPPKHKQPVGYILVSENEAEGLLKLWNAASFCCNNLQSGVC